MADAENTQEAMEVKEDNEESTADNAGGAEDKKTEEAEDGQKTEEELAAQKELELEQELKEIQLSIPRFAPHSIPEWDLQAMRERWMWSLKIFPIDQEDCRNCLLDSATKMAQESWYYVPKRKNGQGSAEMVMVNAAEAKGVMGRVIRMPFYHHYVTIEVTKRSTPQDSSAYSEIVETATVVLDTTKSERIKNTAKTLGSNERRNLWVRYLPENTSADMLRVLFPLSNNTPEVKTHDDLRIGLVESNSKTDVLVFMKAFVTVIINGAHILALQNKQPAEDAGKETENKDELDKTVASLESLDVAPVEAADRTELRKTDKAHTNRILKRTFQTQQRNIDNNKRKDKGGMQGRGEPPAKRGSGGHWNDRRSGGRGGGGGGGRFNDGGYGGGGNRGPRGAGGGFGGFGMDTHGMAAEMMMMQAQLNQTIQNQLSMLNPGRETLRDPLSHHFGGDRRRDDWGGSGGYGGGRGGGGRRGGGRGGGRRW